MSSSNQQESESSAANSLVADGAKLMSVSKQDLVKKFAIKDGDCGSPEVQIAILTRELEKLAKHFSAHSQDKHSQRGLMAKVGRRKKLLDYLRKEDIQRYRQLIGSLGLRK